MAVQTSYPGVYVQEVSSGVRTITGVSTSIAVFIGRTAQGPMNKPIQCLSYIDFEREFSSDTSFSEMPYYVKLFFMNGGTNCYVVRIANGASPAYVNLKNEEGEEVLKLTAKQYGLFGETIRARVTYAGTQPEFNFNLELFSTKTNSAGKQIASNTELHSNLNMNPNSSRYAPDIISQDSRLVNATIGSVPGLLNGYSQSGRPIPYTTNDDSFKTAIKQLIGNDASANDFLISIDGNVPVPVSMATINIANFTGSSLLDSSTTDGSLAKEIATKIQTAYNAINVTGISVIVSFEAGPTPQGASNSALLRITSGKTDNTGSVVITPGGPNDAAGPLMLGTAQGGLEVSPYTAWRPAANGLTFNAPADWVAFAEMDQNSITEIVLDELDSSENSVPVIINVDLIKTEATDKMFKAASGYSAINDDNDGVREKLALIRDAVNNYQKANPRKFFWRAILNGYRLSITSSKSNDNHTAPIFNNFISNVRNYSLGVSGTGDYQKPALIMASDGNAPVTTDYDKAYLIVEKDVDLFNLLILPPDKDPSNPQTELWGPASIFCQQQRAFLLMDAPSSWTSTQLAANGVDALRRGLVKDHSAVFYPRLKINDDGRQVQVGASGAIAGLMARIDSTRGVWKAPAGTEADLRNIIGVEYNFSDRENGVLNPRGINTIRVFPNGIVNWGARTMDGDDDFGSEYKYIPVRRLALYIEESLYRGLKWVVFEPNDEPLWAQIRLNVGAFMHNLFRQGAFQGTTKKDAYFVKCDSETTTQNDIDLGRVNIWVGFAPLKPAEFVILYLQQIAGKILA